MEVNLRDQLIAEKLQFAEAARLVGNVFLSAIKDNSKLLGNSLFVPRNIKKRSRIIAKIERYQGEKPHLSLSQVVDMITDFVGGRLLGHSLSDAYRLFENFCAAISDRNDIKMYGECDDCINTPRDTGFRAITQVILFRIRSRPVIWFPFEVQIMTFLAHDWDQKQHDIYEHKEHVPQHIQEMFKAMSYRLLEVDEHFEIMRTMISDFIPPGK